MFKFKLSRSVLLGALFVASGSGLALADYTSNSELTIQLAQSTTADEAQQSLEEQREKARKAREKKPAERRKKRSKRRFGSFS